MTRPLVRSSLIGVAVALCVVSTSAPASARQTQEAQPATLGRVVATVTTLDGTVHVPLVQVDLVPTAEATVIATTTTDGRGIVTFPDVPPGRYVIRATRSGFTSTSSAVFDVRPAAVTRVLVDIKLTFVMPDVEVRAAMPSPTDSVQPVSMSDMLDGDVLDVAPLVGDDFHSLMQLLPGVVRGPDGRLRVKGGQPTQGALQVSSASLIDPSTGDFDLDMPGQSIESVEVLANPFAAEYGRFTSSVTQIHTRRGTNAWEIKPGNLLPRIRRSFAGVRSFEPRFSIRGPLKQNRVFVAEDLQFRYVTTPVRSLEGDPVIRMKSFDSFTRVDAVTSARHTLGGGLIVFPRRVTGVTMNTFRPREATPRFTQNGVLIGAVDRFAIAPTIVLETTLSVRTFYVHVNTDGGSPMVYMPQTQSGIFFNDQERQVASQQWVEALSLSHKLGRGEHVFKTGIDVQRSSYDGFSLSRPVEIRRLDGSLAERTVFGPRAAQDVSGLELALFAQDRWHLGPRATLELGFRLDRDPVVGQVNYSPRAGVALGVLPEGRAVVRGGFGKFVQRTPLNVEAFPSFEPYTVSRFPSNGLPASVTFRNVVDAALRTPEATVGNIEWDQRFGRRSLVKLAFLRRYGSHDYILSPDPTRGESRLTSTGTSAYRELEATTRYLGGGRRDLTISYVWARGEADLNNYDQFFGNLRNPILRANQHNLIPTDVRHRLLVRGTLGLPGRWDLAPVLELRSGFPWSAVDEFQDFVGDRNRAGRLPAVRTLDFSLARPWRFGKYRFRAGLKMYNVFGASAERDVQNNVSSPDYGTFYNPIERSIGFVLGSAK
jgi:TonB dependent receptor-like, beta-barrel/Carboxypeptidase regulatory-like domain